MPAILVVDDEAEIRDLMDRVLTREGYVVDKAVDGLAALQALAGRDYDLVICNVRMPVMDGPTLYARVRGFDPALAGRFVFCTGDIVSPDVQAFLLSVNQPVLVKPFGIAGLREMARRFTAEPVGPRYRLPCRFGEPSAAPSFPA